MSRHRAETIKYLTTDEIKRLISAIKDHRNRAIFLIAYRHGLRASEVGLLHVNDLNLKQLRIRLTRLKGSLGGEHPLQPDEARFIKAHLKHRKIDSPILFITNRNAPINKRMLDVLMKKYGDLAK